MVQYLWRQRGIVCHGIIFHDLKLCMMDDFVKNFLFQVLFQELHHLPDFTPGILTELGREGEKVI